jgi:single-strand DNA-binding protein
MNVFTFVGNLGGDAELRVTAKGTDVCQFSVAATAGYGEHKTTTWVRCSLFGKRAQSLAPYLIKGQQVCITGEAKVNEWTNRGGEVKSSLEVMVTDVMLLGEKKQATDKPPVDQRQAITGDIPIDYDSDVPF